MTSYLGIIVPTYKEQDNIYNLLKRVQTEVEKYKITTHLLVMDDSSPDRTREIIEAYQAQLNSQYLQISLHVRKSKMGLASAYTTGIKILKANCKYLLEMDADLSHKPEYIHDFVEKAKQGYDLIIGSRYVKGGGVENWSWIRKTISTNASRYSRSVLGLKVRDLTGGYNMYNSKVFDTVNLDKIMSSGYLFQIEMKYKTIKNNFKWTEVPIIFPDRVAGKSKFNKTIMLEALVKIWQVKFTS
jgi:dolichol-phosphate mannosyltransferase